MLGSRDPSRSERRRSFAERTRSFIALRRFWRAAQHHVPVGCVLASLRAFGFLPGDHQSGLRLRVADAAEDAIALVLRVAFDVTLGDEEFLAPLLDLVMDVRRAARVGDRLDCAEVVFALRV